MEEELSRIRRKKNAGKIPAKENAPISTHVHKDAPEEILPSGEGTEGNSPRHLEEPRALSPHYFSRSGLLGDIVEKLPLGIMGRDMTGGGRYVFWNAFMEELTGISRKRILHHSGESVLSRGLQDLFQEQDLRVVREERSLDCGMVPFPGASGTRIHMVKILFREGSTGHTLVISVLRDLSRQAVLEGRLRSAERSLGLLREHTERLGRILRVAAEQAEVKNALSEQLSQALGIIEKIEDSQNTWEESSRQHSPQSGRAVLNVPPEVFLLERNATVRAFALRTLQWENWPVHTGENLEELLTLAEAKEPGNWLFLLGYEHLDFPRGIPGKVVVLRGEEMSEKDIEECRRRGYEICPKPFAAWELLESLKRCAAGGVEKEKFSPEPEK